MSSKRTPDLFRGKPTDEERAHALTGVVRARLDDRQAGAARPGLNADLAIGPVWSAVDRALQKRDAERLRDFIRGDEPAGDA